MNSNSTDDRDRDIRTPGLEPGGFQSPTSEVQFPPDIICLPPILDDLSPTDEPSGFANESFRDEWSRKVVAHTSRLSSQAAMQHQHWERIKPFYLAAQQTFQRRGRHLGAAECVRNRAIRHLQHGLYDKAEELCRQALEWALMVNEDELRVSVLHTMAAVKSVTGETDESIRILRLCLADLRAIGNTAGQAHVLLNIGYTQRRIGKYRAAHAGLVEALAIALRINDLHTAAACYMNLIRCFLAEHDSTHIQSTIAGARRILFKMQSISMEAELNLLECRALTVENKLNEASLLLNKTYQLVARHDLKELCADVQFEQGLLYGQIGEAQTAACKLVAAAQQYRQLGYNERYEIAIEVLDRLKETVDV